MSLLRIDSSIRVDGSSSRAIADIVEEAWTSSHDGDPVVRRQIGVDPIPATFWAAAVGAADYAPEDHSAEQRSAAGLATELVDELTAADALLIAVPLYNFGVSQHFKSYVDLVTTDRRMAPGSAPLAGKPAVLVMVRGGSYGPGSPREGWDHATGWIRRILAEVWHLDLSVVENEFTLAGVDPGLDQFAELGARLRVEAEELAHKHGSALVAARR